VVRATPALWTGCSVAGAPGRSSRAMVSPAPTPRPRVAAAAMPTHAGISGRLLAPAPSSSPEDSGTPMRARTPAASPGGGSLRGTAARVSSTAAVSSSSSSRHTEQSAAWDRTSSRVGPCRCPRARSTSRSGSGCSAATTVHPLATINGAVQRPLALRLTQPAQAVPDARLGRAKRDLLAHADLLRRAPRDDGEHHRPRLRRRQLVEPADRPVRLEPVHRRLGEVPRAESVVHQLGQELLV